MFNGSSEGNDIRTFREHFVTYLDNVP
jgi:hypothetical protein